MHVITNHLAQSCCMMVPRTIFDLSTTTITSFMGYEYLFEIIVTMGYFGMTF